MPLLLPDVIKLAVMRDKRKSLGLSQSQAAGLAGLSGKQAWYAIEKGVNQNVTLETLYAIASVLKCTPHDLLSIPPSRRQPE